MNNQDPPGRENALALLQAWADRAESWVYVAPSGKVYAFLTEPDHEGPRMQYLGAQPEQAVRYVQGRQTRFFQ